MKTKRKANKGTAKLKKIVAEAKRMRKSSPGTKWTTLVSRAAKKLR